MRYVLINMEDSTVDAVIGFEETRKQKNASVSLWTISCLFQPFEITSEIMHTKKCLKIRKIENEGGKVNNQSLATL